MNKATFTEDLAKKTITVERTLEAPIEKVWAAWTRREQLERWWAPRPWQAVTKSFDFTEGGRWHYYMAGPEGERHWCLVDFKTIEPLEGFTAVDAFCDEHAIRNDEMPGMDWRNRFEADGSQTHVTVTLTFISADELKRIVDMGFKEGFSMGLDQLERLLAE